MKSVRDDFLFLFASTADALGEVTTPAGALGLQVAGPGLKPMAFLKSVATWLRKSENRQKALCALWVFLVFVLFLLTGTVIFGSHWLTPSYKPGISIATFVWAFFSGIWVLFFFPAKLVTTIFGGLGGIGITELGTGSGLIAKANTSITGIATQIGLIVGNPDVSTQHFITWMVWLFFLVLLITCLPAFFRDK